MGTVSLILLYRANMTKQRSSANPATIDAGITSHHFFPLVAARAPSTQERTAQAKLMGARHSRYGGMKMLRRRAALAIPAFVDLFTSYLRCFAIRSFHP